MKQFSILALGLVAALASGCVGMRAVSSNITEHGTVARNDIVFPELNKAWQKGGQFPNRENLSKIRAGVTKDELYQLIGHPHFSERQHAREWDYILKFYQPDNSVKTCQYKVIFDKQFKGQEFYWQPADCAAYAKPVAGNVAPTVIYQTMPTAAPVVINQSAPIVNEKINLSADALFVFDKWRAEDMREQGRRELDDLAEKLRTWQTRGDSRVVITGHTDRLGDDIYNLNLSQLRAQTVRGYLAERGVDLASMVATGAGAGQPVKMCDDNQPRQQLITCLQPNRRVEVAVAVYAAK